MKTYTIKASVILDAIIYGVWEYHKADNFAPAEWRYEFEGLEVPGTASTISFTVYGDAPFTAFKDERDFPSTLKVKENPDIIDMVWQARDAFEDYAFLVEGGELEDLDQSEYSIEVEDDISSIPGIGSMSNAEVGDIVCRGLGGWKAFVESSTRAYKSADGVMGYLFSYSGPVFTYCTFSSQAMPGVEPKFKDFGAPDNGSDEIDRWIEGNGFSEVAYGHLYEITYDWGNKLVRWGGAVSEICDALKLPDEGREWLEKAYARIKQDVLDDALGEAAPAYY